MMNKDEIKPVIAAWLNDQPIEFRCSDAGGWREASGIRPDFFNPEFEWRVKPEKKLRPWKPEEVPVGAVFKHRDDYRESLIIGRDVGCGMKIVMTTHGCEPRLTDMRTSEIDPANYIWKWPQETEWHPCGIEE